MTSIVVEKKQENGRYKPDGKAVYDNAYVYKLLCTALYRHSLNRHCNRIQVKRIDDNTLQFTVTYYGNQFRSVFTVDNIGY